MHALTNPTRRLETTLRLLTGMACSLALVGAIPSAALARRPLEPLTPGASSPFAAFGPSLVRDTVITGRRALTARALTRILVRGGTFYTPAGEPIKVYVTDSYVFDRVAIQTYVNFIAALWHSREITTLTVYLLTPVEVGLVCGSSSLACYAPSSNELVAPGETVPGQASLENTVAHEYAHHVINHRNNDPWSAYKWGPKRWATYMNVCRLVREHRAFPGDEGKHYAWNPGEGWGAGYAYANGYGWFPVVAAYWKPNSAAAARIKQDSLQPWSGDVTRTLSGRIGPRGSTRTTVGTPLDGSLHLRLTGPRGALFRLGLYAGSRLVRSSQGTGRNQAIDYTVCGVRQFAVTISAIRGSGKYTLTVKRP